MRATISLLAFSLLVGCSSGVPGGTADSSTPPDLSASSTGDMALLSACGHHGDTGNSLGVGQFCQSISDCTGTATFCTAFVNGATPMPDDTYFCTIIGCHPDGGTVVCGENAGCVCDPMGRGCACTPNSCIGP